MQNEGYSKGPEQEVTHNNVNYLVPTSLGARQQREKRACSSKGQSCLLKHREEYTQPVIDSAAQTATRQHFEVLRCIVHADVHKHVACCVVYKPTYSNVSSIEPRVAEAVPPHPRRQLHKISDTRTVERHNAHFVPNICTGHHRTTSSLL